MGQARTNIEGGMGGDKAFWGDDAAEEGAQHDIVQRERQNLRHQHGEMEDGCKDM